MRAYAVDLLLWLWESRSPLPDNMTTLARLARADNKQSFAHAWARLAAPNGRGIFVLTEYGYICPLQDEARGLQQQRSKAGKASVHARRQTSTTGGVPLRVRKRFDIFKRDHFTCRYCGAKAPDVELEVDHVIPVNNGGTDDPENLITACVSCNSGKAHLPLHEGQHPVRTQIEQSESARISTPPVEKPGQPVEKPGRIVEIGPPQTPPLSPVRTYVLGDLDQEPAAAGAALSLESNFQELDETALQCARYLLRSGAPMGWDAFRDATVILVDDLEHKGFIGGAGLDKTALTYRLWDETFLGAYRDRFTTTRDTIKLTPRPA
jgi:hypothetical protein